MMRMVRCWVVLLVVSFCFCSSGLAQTESAAQGLSQARATDVKDLRAEGSPAPSAIQSVDEILNS